MGCFQGRIGDGYQVLLLVSLQRLCGIQEEMDDWIGNWLN